MAGHLFILCGASGSGKSTLIQEIVVNDPHGAAVAPKYSTRARREGWDDIIHVSHIDVEEFDIAYVLNGRRYGLRRTEIEAVLLNDKDVFVVLSDLRVVSRVKEMFGPRAHSIYISSPLDRRRLMEIHGGRYSIQPLEERRTVIGEAFTRLNGAARLRNWRLVNQLIAEVVGEWRDAVPEIDSVEVRVEKIRTLHIRYVDHIELFDHVVLNYTSVSDMVRQMLSIRAAAIQKDRQPSKIKQQPPIYVVAAASAAGKGTLMEALNTLGRDRIRLLTKVAARDPKKKDRRQDGMKALGKGASIPPEYDFRWWFHKGDGFEGTEYGISEDEVRANVEAGAQQIVVSNMGQFSEFRRRFGERVVFLYLHATRSREQVVQYQQENCERLEEAEQRIREIDEVHQEYVQRVAEFDHVLLNTTYEEDLYDQMFQLIDYYSSERE